MASLVTPGLCKFWNQVALPERIITQRRWNYTALHRTILITIGFARDAVLIQFKWFLCIFLRGYG